MAKKKTPAEAQQAIYRPDLPFTGLEDDDATKKKADADTGPTTKELLALIDGLRGDLQRTQSANAALMAQPVVQAPPKVRTEIDVNALPDPVEDPKGYAAALGAQQKEILDGQTAIQNYTNEQITSQQAKIDALWNRFNGMEVYKPYASKPKLVQYAANEVVAEKRAAGLDVSKYVFLNSDQFMADVVAKIDKEFGKPSVPGEETDDDTGSQEDDGRTQGIAGGLETGGRPSAGAQAPQTDDMFTDLKNWQLTSGFSR